jgi:hypothetical protein
MENTLPGEAVSDGIIKSIKVVIRHGLGKPGIERDQSRRWLAMEPKWLTGR